MEIWNTINRANILTAGVQEKYENATGVETFFKEIVMEIFPKLKQHTSTHAWKGLRSPVRLKLAKSMAQNIIIKFPKVKKKEGYKSSKRTETTYNSIPIFLTTDFSAETVETRRDRVDTHISSKLWFLKWRSNKYIPRHKKLREFITTRSALKEMLKGILQPQRKILHTNKTGNNWCCKICW